MDNEAQLLELIHQGVTPELRSRYDALQVKLEAEMLTEMAYQMLNLFKTET